MTTQTLPSHLSPAAARAPLPRPAAVLREQLRAVGLALRPELLGFGLLLFVFVVLRLVDLALREQPMANTGLNFTPDSAAYAVWLAFLTPLFVWRSEGPSRRDYFWSLPVDHRRHALLRLAAGWGWQMAIVAAVLLLMLGAALLSGSEVGVMREAISSSTTTTRGTTVPPGAHLSPMPAPAVLAVPLWLWLTPFTAATIAYLLGSAAALASDYPVRWLLGLLFAVLLLPGTLLLTGEPAAASILDVAWSGQLGLDTAFNGKRWMMEHFQGPGWALTRQVGRPDLGRWLPAMLLWLGLGALAAYLAAGYRPGAWERLRRWGWRKQAG